MAPALTMVQATATEMYVHHCVDCCTSALTYCYKLLLLKCMYTTVWTVVYYLSVVEL